MTKPEGRLGGLARVGAGLAVVAAAMLMPSAASAAPAVHAAALPAAANQYGGDRPAWVTAEGGLQFHAPVGPDAGGRLVDANPRSDEYLIAGDWNGDGRDTVAWVTRQGGLQFHAGDGPDAGGRLVDANPHSDEYLIAGDWNGDGRDTVAWVTREGGLQFHAGDGPDAGGRLIDANPHSDEYLIAGDWNGDGRDTVAWVTRQGGLQFHAGDGPDAGGRLIDANPHSDEVLIAGDWNGDGRDTVAWVTREGGLQFHAGDGPDAGGRLIDANPHSDEYLISGNWNGEGVADCTAANSCTPTTFADALLAFPGVNAPRTAANINAIKIWERREGGGKGCPNSPPEWSYSPGPAGNPLNTTRAEPGSSNYNSVGVQQYRDFAGHTCWYWGLQADGGALTNGLYANIINVLRTPSADNRTQCIRLAQAVGNSPWGTGNFSANC